MKDEASIRRSARSRAIHAPNNRTIAFRPRREEYYALLALTVIASISVVGIVLVNALLVIPAATAKLLARSLGQMVILAPLLGIGSVLVGLVVSS